jgi:hypothetical protein
MPQDKQNRMQTAGEQPQAMAEKCREVDEEKKHTAMTRKQLSIFKEFFAAKFPVSRFPWASSPSQTAVKSAADAGRPQGGLDSRITEVLRIGGHGWLDEKTQVYTPQQGLQGYTQLVTSLWTGARVNEFAGLHPTITDPLAWFIEGFSRLAAITLEGENEFPSEGGISLGMLALATADVIASLDDEGVMQSNPQQGSPDYREVSRTLRRLRDISAAHAAGVAAALVLDNGFNEAVYIGNEMVSVDSSRRATMGGHKKESADMVKFHEYLDKNYDHALWPKIGREDLVLTARGGPGLQQVVKSWLPKHSEEYDSSTIIRWLAVWEKKNGITRKQGPKPKG